MRRAWAAAVAGLALSVAAWLAAAGGAWAAQRPAPDYTAKMLDSGEDVSVADLRGQVVLLNTWATWCVPCREEMPAFQALHERLGGQGLRVVAVSIDQGPADAKVADYVQAAGITFEIWRDPTSRITHAFRVLGPPETFLITKDGQIAHHWRGQVDPNAPENLTLIRQAMGLEQADPGAAAATGAAATATVGLLVAFGAGLLSVLSPCVLPLVPSYASVIAGVSVRRTRSLAPATVGAAQVSRSVALRAGLAFVAGFTAVFMTLGVLVNRAGALLADQRVWLTRAGGVVLVLLGLHLLGVLRVPGADREVRFSRLGSGRAGYAGVFLVGVAFAAGWSPCIGPVLAGILTMAASGGSTGASAALLGAYSAGLAIPFLAAAVALDRFLGWSAKLRRSWLPVAERVSGALVLAVGIVLLTGLFTRLAAALA
ncbi:MAG: cytochrome c biogenesis protein CcdA [Egibacteraceae bacterium]